MLYLIKPHKDLLEKQTDFIKRFEKLTKHVTATYIVPRKHWSLHWNSQDKKQIICSLDFLYKVIDGKLLIDCISLDCDVDLSDINAAEVFESIIISFFRLLKNFDFYDLHSGKVHTVTENTAISKLAIEINTSQKEAYTTYNEFFGKDFKSLSDEEYVEHIHSLPSQLQPIYFVTLISQAKKSEQKEIEFQTNMFVEISKAIEKIESKYVQEFLLYKAILFHKVLQTSLMGILSQKQIVHSVLPLLSHMDVSRELVQLLYVDVILDLANISEYYDNSELVSEILDTIKSNKTNFIFYPEIRTIIRAWKTGSIKKAFGTYVKFDSQYRNLKQSYENQTGKYSLSADFRNGIVLGIYWKILTFTEKLKYWAFYLRYRGGYLAAKALPASLLVFFVIIGALFPPAIYLYNRFSGFTTTSQFVDFDFLIYFVSQTVFISAVLIAMSSRLEKPLAHFFYKNLSFHEKVARDLARIFGSFLMTFFIIYAIISSMVIMDTSGYWGVNKSEIIIGQTYHIPLEKVKSVQISQNTCEQNQDSCETVFTITAKNDQTDQSIKTDDLNNARNRADACQVVKELLTQITQNKIELVISPKESTVLSETCHLPNSSSK